MNKQLKAKRDKLIKAIDTFLAVRGKSVAGGFAQVGDDDMEQLYAILELLREIKYEKDADGDLPVQFMVVDRTKFESLHYVCIPYTHKCKTEDELFGAIDAAQLNASIANDTLERMFKIWSFHRREMKQPK